MIRGLRLLVRGGLSLLVFQAQLGHGVMEVDAQDHRLYL
jgi:hypothetical protein